MANLHICPGCNGEVDRDVSLSCDLCSRGMHSSCAGLTAEEVVMLRRIRRRSAHLKILCIDCNGVLHAPSPSPAPTEQKACLEEDTFLGHVRNIVSKEIDLVKSELSAQIEVLKQSNEDLVKFFTEKNSSLRQGSVSSAKTKQGKKIVIKPKDSNQDIAQTQCNDDLEQSKIDVNQISPVSGGGVIISCENEAGQDKLKQKLGDKYNVKFVSSLRPKIRVVGLSEDIAKDDIITYLLSQNSDLIVDPSSCSLVRHWPTAKNKNIFQAEVQIDTSTYSQILNRGSVLIGLTSCSVFDAVSIPRCFNCNGLHHMYRQCQQKVCCPVCAGQHDIKKCDAPRHFKKCVNCVSLENKPEGTNVSHAAWDYDQCTAYKYAVDSLKSNLFGIPCSKN
jgi:hypothetical protein